MPKSAVRGSRKRKEGLKKSGGVQEKDKKKDGQQSAKERREAKKVAFLEKLHQTARRATVERKAKKVGTALATLGSLTEALEAYQKEVDATSSQPKAKNKKTHGMGKLSNKQRKKLQMEEVNLFKQVLQHPAIKANPLETIKQHLQNTFAPSTEEAE